MGEFSERLRALLENQDGASPLGKRVSQKELADFIGVSKSTISLWVMGETEANVSGLIALSKFFGVSSDYLIGLSDRKTENESERINRALKVLQEMKDGKYFERLQSELEA